MGVGIISLSKHKFLLMLLKAGVFPGVWPSLDLGCCWFGVTSSSKDFLDVFVPFGNNGVEGKIYLRKINKHIQNFLNLIMHVDQIIK